MKRTEPECGRRTSDQNMKRTWQVTDRQRFVGTEISGPEPPNHRKTVAMMVWNTCENDSRVIKEATTLARAGYNVTVVCLTAEHLPDVEHRDGVTYQRVPRVFGLVRRRVDLVFNVFAFVLLAPVATALIGLAAWQASGLWGNATRTQLAVAAPLVFMSGFLLGLFAKRIARFARQGLPHLRRVRIRLPLRRRVLFSVYRLFTFRLVQHTMREAVAGLQPDVIHAHDLQTLPAASRIARELGATLIYDSHELATHVSTRPPPLFRLWIAWTERRTIPHADLVITVSEGISQHLAKKYRIQRPALVYNSPPVAAGRSCGRDVRNDLALADGVPLALYVGALTANRGLEQTVDSLAFLPDFYLACVGPRRDDWESEMRARARLSGSADRLHFLNPVPIEELVAYISTADVGVIAIQNITLSYWYTMPNKLFETVLAGVPVVVANLPHLREFVEQHKVGLVSDETDPAALAQAMRDVIERPELRPSGDRLDRLRRKFSWEAQAEHLVALYRDLGAPASAPAESE